MRRDAPITMLIDNVDRWWEYAQYRSPHSPEAIAQAAKNKEEVERSNAPPPEAKLTFTERLRLKQIAKNLKK